MKAITLSKRMTVIGLAFLVGFVNVKAQDESPVDLGLDIYSSYIWRGAKFGSGPAFQPWVEGAFGDLAIGAWGSVNASADESLEMDLYVGYSFGPVSVTVTDYYFGGDWLDFGMNHYIEPSLGLEFGDVSVTAAYMLLPGTEGVAFVAGIPAMINPDNTITPAVEEIEAVEESSFGSSGDLYFELAYAFKNVDLAVGAGNGQYVSEDHNFMLCNITLGTSKEIAITENFSLPISGSVTLNPSTGGFFIAAGVSF